MLQKVTASAYYLGRKSLDQQSDANFKEENELSDQRIHNNWHLTLLTDNDGQQSSALFGESLNQKVELQNYHLEIDEPRPSLKKQPIQIEPTAQKILQDVDDNEAEYDEKDLESLNFSQTKMQVDRQSSSPELNEDEKAGKKEEKEEKTEMREALKDEYLKLRSELKNLEEKSLKRKSGHSQTRKSHSKLQQLNAHHQITNSQHYNQGQLKKDKHKKSAYLNNGSASHSKSKCDSTLGSGCHSRCSSQMVIMKQNQSRECDFEKGQTKDKPAKHPVGKGKGKNLVEEYRRVGFGKSSLPGTEKPNFYNKNQKQRSRIQEQLAKEGQIPSYGKQNENGHKILGRNSKDYSNLYSRYILKDLNNGSHVSLQKALTARGTHNANPNSMGTQEALPHNDSCKSMKIPRKGKSKKKCLQCSKAREAYEDIRANEKLMSNSRRRNSRDHDGRSSKKGKCRQCSKKAKAYDDEQMENINFATRSVDDRVSKRKIQSSCCLPKGKEMKSSLSCKKRVQQNFDQAEEPLSPSKLNEELNKILETEKKIKEYKDMITQLQRDMYSKKPPQTSNNNSIRQSLVQKRKIFQEDLTPSTSIKSLIRLSQPMGKGTLELSLRENDQIREQKSARDTGGLSKTNEDCSNQHHSSKDYSVKEAISIIEDSFKSSLVTKNPEPIQKQVESVIEEEIEEAVITNQREAVEQKEEQQMEVQGTEPFDEIVMANFLDQECIETKQEIKKDAGSMISCQQQQEIVNFYMEFQYDDQSDVTPLSTFSGQISSQQQFQSLQRLHPQNEIHVQETIGISEGKPTHQSNYQSSNRWSEAPRMNKNIQVLEAESESSQRVQSEKELPIINTQHEVQEINKELQTSKTHHLQQSADRGKRNMGWTIWNRKKSSVLSSYASQKRCQTPSKELDPNEMIMQSQKKLDNQQFKNAITEYLAKPLSKKPPLITSLLGTNSSRNTVSGPPTLSQLESFKKRRNDKKFNNIPKPSYSQGPSMYSKQTNSIQHALQKALNQTKKPTLPSNSSLSSQSKESSLTPSQLQLTIQKAMKNQNVVKCQTIDLTNIYNKSKAGTPCSVIQNCKERKSEGSFQRESLEKKLNFTNSKRKGLQLSNEKQLKSKWSASISNNFATPITKVTLNM